MSIRLYISAFISCSVLLGLFGLMDANALLSPKKLAFEGSKYQATSISFVTKRKTIKAEVAKLAVKQKIVKKIVEKVEKKPVAKKLVNVTKKLPTTNQQLPTKSIPTIKGSKLVTNMVKPNYPRRALKRKQQGTVWIKALLNTDGNISNVKVDISSGHRSLDESAFKAVQKWSFNSYKDSLGNSSKAWVSVPVEFRI